MSTSFPSRLLVSGAGTARGRVVVDTFVVEPPADGTDSGPNFDAFTLSKNLVIEPSAAELMVFCQGVKEPYANVTLDQAQGPTILNIVWTRQPVGGEFVEVIYVTED